MTLPVQPLSLLAGGIPNELLIRSEQEVLRIQIEPLKILERNAKFEFEFGDEKCFLTPLKSVLFMESITPFSRRMKKR